MSTKSAQIAKYKKQINTLQRELSQVEARIESRRGVFNRDPASVQEKNRVRNLEGKIRRVEERLSALQTPSA